MIKASSTHHSPLYMPPIPGLEAMDLPFDFGWAQFRAAESALEMPLHLFAWADTEKDVL